MIHITLHQLLIYLNQEARHLRFNMSVQIVVFFKKTNILS